MSLHLNEDYDVDEVRGVALNLVNGTLNIATSLIARDPDRVFVYVNPFVDDLRPEHEESYSQKEFNLNKLSFREESLSESYEKFHHVTLQHALGNMWTDSQESFKTIQSRRYTYVFKEPLPKTSLTASMPGTGRYTFESNIIRTEAKQPNQEQLWNYIIADASSGSEEDLKDNNIHTREQDIYNIKQLLYQWPTIEEFTLNETLITIQRFVNLWKLSANTKFAIMPETPYTKSCLGDKYHVTVAFSKPTKMCPNPLAVAYVNFEINYSYVMPPYFPITVTYRFETYNNSYHILGNRNMRSITFQNYYIESILNAKLSFYAKIYETTYGPLSQKLKEYSVDEEYEIFKKQTEIDLDSSATYKPMKPTFVANVPDTGDSIFKSHRTLINILRPSEYQHMINTTEPWRMRLYDTSAVESTHNEIKQNEDIVDLESQQYDDLKLKKNLSVFGFTTSDDDDQKYL